MAYALDTLGYAKRLRDAGVSLDQAEAHAEAAREFIMAELVTKPDLLVIRQDMAALRQELSAVDQRLTAKLDLMASKQELEAVIKNVELRLTLRMGSVLGIAVAILAAIIKL